MSIYKSNMSSLTNDIYGQRLNDLTFAKDAWLFGKFCGNEIHDFNIDPTKQFGRSLKSRLKLSPKGLTWGSAQLKIHDPSRGASREHYDLSSIYDIYQDRTFLNVLVCVIKSRFLKFNYEVFTYKLRHPKDVMEFQDLFTELVTGTPKQKEIDQVDYKLSTINLSDTRKRYGGVYASSNGYAKSGNFGYGTYSSRFRDTTDFEPRSLKRERYSPRRTRLRDVAIQASRARVEADDQCQMFCRRAKVYSLNDSVLSDVACMASSSRNFDEYDGEAVALTRNRSDFSRKRNVYYDDMYQTYPIVRNTYETRAINSSIKKTGKETQTRVLSISDSNSLDEIQVQLTGESNRNSYYRSQDYLDYSPVYDRREFMNQGMNGDVHHSRRAHF